MNKLFTQCVAKALSLTMVLASVTASGQRLTTRRVHEDEQAKMPRIISSAYKGNRGLDKVGIVAGQQRAAAQIKTADTDLDNEALIDEDFSLFTAGSEDAPDGTCLCVLDGTKESPRIDAQYTHQPGWTGGRVYQAGGMAALIPADEGLSAVLNSPYGDYSGNLTITFRMKSIDPTGRTFFFLNCLRNGIDAPKDCLDKDGEYVYYKYNLKNEEGWKEFTVELNNCSADADGFLQFNCCGQVLLDDFKVIARNDFIAAPRLRQAKDFTRDGFTVTWDKMRVAESYDVKVFCKKFSDKEEEVFTANFEDGIDAGFKLTRESGDEPEFTEDGGFEGSRGLILREGDVLEAPYNSALIKSMTLYLNFVLPDGEEWDYYSCLNIQGYDPKYNDWVDGEVWCEDLQDYVPDVFDCEVDFYDFNDWFQKVKFIPETMPEGAYVVIDRIEIVTNRPFEYIQDGTDYTTTDNEVAVTVTEPEETYFYQVTAHLQDMVGQSGLQEDIGVATPEPLEATDIDERGSFTANWESVPKASGYIVEHFGVFTAAEECDYALVNENFDKVDESVTEAATYTDFESLGNYSYADLGAYTDFPGWIGINNVVSQGMLGCAAAEDMYAMLYTPMVCATDCGTVNVTIKAYGKANDYLMVCNSVGNWGISFLPIEGDETNGVIDGTFEIPASDVNEMYCLLSFKSKAFLIDEFAIEKHLLEGDKAEVFIEEVVIEDGAVTSHVFDNLDSQPCNEFAYNVTAYLDHADTNKRYMSSVSEMVYVDLTPAGIGNEAIFDAADAAAEVEIYNLMGRKVNADNLTGGVYVVKKGNVVSKTILRK